MKYFPISLENRYGFINNNGQVMIEPKFEYVCGTRYIVELLAIIRFLKKSKDHPSVVFLHGPLVNSYETYDEEEPNYIPGLDMGFLNEQEIKSDDVISEVKSIPKNSDGERLWNQLIAVYGYMLKKLFSNNIPIIGVIERSVSQSFTKGILSLLQFEGSITESYKRKIISLLKKYKISDDFLFGCVLEEGEYITPIVLTKNFQRRSHERWQSVIQQFPNPFAKILKTSSSRFPFRVEMNCNPDNSEIKEIFSLLYHTSLLLPNYAFPVGLDIADKYTKIPDWLSKGVSTSLTAIFLSKALKTGNPRILMQTRQLLASSPRDFFFRPGIK